jgi:DNA-3-methyladenine glycosylase
MHLLPRSFYLRSDVVGIARELLGKYLITRIDGDIAAGVITETEAYAGVSDRASHAFGNRYTSRTQVMYSPGGTAYVYLCYGIHSLFNIVTNQEGIPHAILVRGIRPVEGIPVMLKRSGKPKVTKDFGDGPGKVARLLGIHYSHSGTDLTVIPDDPGIPAIWLEDRGIHPGHDRIEISPRIGVDYAGDDALLPYRFRMRL